ncbi:unnamed protein product, partial [Ceratitis capitata]
MSARLSTTLRHVMPADTLIHDTFRITETLQLNGRRVLAAANCVLSRRQRRRRSRRRRTPQSLGNLHIITGSFTPRIDMRSGSRRILVCKTMCEN